MIGKFLNNTRWNLKDGLFQTNLIFIAQFFNLVIFYLKLFLIKNKKNSHFLKYKNRAMMKGKVN